MLNLPHCIIMMSDWIIFILIILCKSTIILNSKHVENYTKKIKIQIVGTHTDLSCSNSTDRKFEPIFALSKFLNLVCGYLEFRTVR